MRFQESKEKICIAVKEMEVRHEIVLGLRALSLNPYEHFHSYVAPVLEAELTIDPTEIY